MIEIRGRMETGGGGGGGGGVGGVVESSGGAGVSSEAGRGGV